MNLLLGTFNHRALWQPAITAILALAVFCSSTPVQAQETAKDFVEPRITRSQFTLLYRQLGLDSTQRMTAEMFFSDYTQELDDLIERLDSEASKAGAQAVQDAMLGKTRLSPEELRDKRVAVLRVYQQGFAEIDDAAENLIAGLESILSPEQFPPFETALRELHRTIYLHPRQIGSDFQEYAGDGVDVLALAANAMKEGGELQQLGIDHIQNVLNEYVHRLDAYLVQSAPSYREGKLLRKIAGIEKNQTAMREIEQSAMARWKNLYQLNLNAVKQIGDIAVTTLGETAKQRWMDRFDQASFTWLFPRRKPDRQIEWIRTQSIDAAILEQAEITYSNYVARRRELSRQAIDIMLRARLEFQAMLYSMMDRTALDERLPRGLHDELLKNSGEQSILDTATESALESLLDATQRESMRKATQQGFGSGRQW